MKNLSMRGFSFSIKNPVSIFETFRVLLLEIRHHDVAWFLLDRKQTSINISTDSSIDFFLISHINF
jgi:hypothetical protein